MSPHASVHSGGAFADAPLDHHFETQNDTEGATADKTVSEDEADIAGLSFGRKKKGSRRNNHGSASGSRSGTGLTAHSLPHHNTGGGSSSGGSGSGYRAPPSASSSSAAVDQRTVTDRDDTNAPPPNRPIPPPASSPTTPLTLSTPSVHSGHLGHLTHPTIVAEPVRSRTDLWQHQHRSPSSEGEEVAGAQFGKPDVEANEFGMITAGTNKGGAGRVKKSYREKRARSQQGKEDGENGEEGGDTFEGFPGF